MNAMNSHEKLDIRAVVNASLRQAAAQQSVLLFSNDTAETAAQSSQEAKRLQAESYVAQQKKFGQVSELLSQKTKESHVALYQDALDSLNRTSAELDKSDRSTANSNHSGFKSLKLDEVLNLNSVWLHELYFATCFDPHSEIFMDSLAYMKLQRDFGTFEDWQRDFIACAMSCSEGWAICGYNIFLQRYVNTFVGQHSSNVMIGLYPLIVVDMWSHSYYRDYATDKKSYLVAMMREINWEIIEDRFKVSEAIAKTVKS
jgi:Fe-Mn family superoxide dismutase